VVEVEVSRDNHYGNSHPERISGRVVEWKSRKQTPIYFGFVTIKKRTLSRSAVENFYRNSAFLIVARTFFFSCRRKTPCSKR
jgi:hypothetical protein